MRRTALLLAVLAAGCVTGPSFYDRRSTDRDSDRLRTAIGGVIEPSLDRHIRGDGRVTDPFGCFSGHSWGNEAYWGTTFALRTPTGAARDVAPDEGRRILTGVRDDVLAAVEKAGANVTWAPAAEVSAAPNPDGKFVIYYRREHRDGGEVAGRVAGKLIPCPGPGEPFSQVRVTLDEWYGK
jgi:hypothetical protein